MTIGMDRMLAHMAWANQKTIAHLQTLPEESLAAFATNPKWHVAEIISHIVDSAEHRAQIASALEAKGFTPVDLDELDLWAFEIETES